MIVCMIYLWLNMVYYWRVLTILQNILCNYNGLHSNSLFINNCFLVFAVFGTVLKLSWRFSYETFTITNLKAVRVDYIAKCCLYTLQVPSLKFQLTYWWLQHLPAKWKKNYLINDVRSFCLIGTQAHMSISEPMPL